MDLSKAIKTQVKRTEKALVDCKEGIAANEEGLELNKIYLKALKDAAIHDNKGKA